MFGRVTLTHATYLPFKRQVGLFKMFGRVISQRTTVQFGPGHLQLTRKTCAVGVTFPAPSSKCFLVGSPLVSLKSFFFFFFFISLFFSHAAV